MIKLYQLSIKDYFNCYWFADFCKFYDDYNICLEPVLPGIELNNFVNQLIGYKEAHNGEFKNIPLGMDVLTGLLVVIYNKIGIVKLEDFEIGKFKRLAFIAIESSGCTISNSFDLEELSAPDELFFSPYAISDRDNNSNPNLKRINYDKIINLKNWELRVSKLREVGLLPIIKHAFYRP